MESTADKSSKAEDQKKVEDVKPTDSKAEAANDSSEQ